MPKKSSKKSSDESSDMGSLRANLLAMKEEAEGGDLPWMARCVPDLWYAIEVDSRSIEIHHDAGPPKIDDKGRQQPDSGWSCYRCQTHLEGSLELTYMEVPFWAMAPFMDAVLETVRDSGWAVFEYQRSREGNNNTAEFQWD